MFGGPRHEFRPCRTGTVGCRTALHVRRAVDRPQARAQVRGEAFGGTLDDAALMVSELVTNALVHGRPGITLRLSFERNCLVVAVGDRGEGLVTCNAPEPEQSSGRGLVVVDALSTRWGVSRTRGQAGKQVWFEVAS